ncbi:TetR/AcrR family transcriptional regulator [Nocardia pseudovaccinii]|uniref:TetR/AcrR family transcriptional regulator n=1 Tax=Nocardia pseudovaccinii TaxID=189540 RepID=UPI003D8E4904
MAGHRITLRDQLLDAALRLFTVHGFGGTSLQDIATEVGCSKASLIYHFASKEAIATELLAPTWDAVEELLTRLDSLPDDQVAAAAVTGFVDLAIRYRRHMALRMLRTAEFDANPALRSRTDQNVRLHGAIAGRSRTPVHQLRARMALGAVVVAITTGPDPFPEHLQHEVLQGALRLLETSSATAELDH